MSNRKIPFPGSQLVIGGSICGEYLGIRRGIALALGEYAELVCANTFILVHAGLQVPAFKFPPIRAGKGACSKPANWSSLPVTVINHALNFRLLSAGVLERQPDRATPRRFGYRVTAKAKTGQRQNNNDARPDAGYFHGNLLEGHNELKRFSSRNPSSPSAPEARNFVAFPDGSARVSIRKCEYSTACSIT